MTNGGAGATIALLGTGLMGSRMARRLLGARHSLAVWNRSPEKADALRGDGARIAETPADAVRGASHVITMLADGPTVRAVLDDGLLEAMEPGAVLIDMSSIKPGEARDHAAMLRERGLDHLDAPVSGGTKGAEAGMLAIMAGGRAETFDAAARVFAPMGRAVHVGPDGSGQLAKLANQTIVAVTIGAVAEAVLLAQAGGADADALREALKGGFADSVILQQHGGRMTARDFEPGGLSKFQLKDLRNATDEAEALDLSLPLAGQMRERFTALVEEMDGGDLDHSAILLELERRNGRQA